MKGGGVGPTIAVYTCISLDITAGLTEASIERAVEKTVGCKTVVRKLYAGQRMRHRYMRHR